MRLTFAFVCGLACLVLPASASAAVTPDRDAPDVAAALTAVAGTGSSFAPIAPLGNPAAVANAPLGGFPTSGGSFAVLSSGDAAKADPANTSNGGQNGSAPTAGGPRPNVWDLTILRLDGTVPTGVNCALFSFRFYTDEAPGSVSFNDGFIAELDSSTWTAPTGAISAPNNFAFDAGGNVMSVNSPGSTGLTPEQAVGTNYQYATARLTAATPITPGAHSLFLSIFDQGDDIFDSAVFVDDLHYEQRPAEECTRGAQDEIAPVVTLTAPANGATTTDHTPTFAGAAGEAPGDANGVSVEIRSAGALVQTLTTTRSATAWSVASAPLGDGQYTARAIQLDESGNTGVSATRTFTITTPPPPPPPQQVETAASQSPTPVLGETVVAGKVGSGTVRVKLKNGKFRTLGANEAIPLGSTVDATKGRVRLTAAAGPGGAVQTADFYKGAFVITQTGGSKKPITQLALSGKLSCRKTTAKKKASTSAGKKVRRLWGDGKGRFRTRGRHGAATVRGTKWLTEDRCDSTKISVKRGSVVVRDYAKKKNKIVKKGQSYVARAKAKKN